MSKSALRTAEQSPASEKKIVLQGLESLFDAVRASFLLMLKRQNIACLKEIK